MTEEVIERIKATFLSGFKPWFCSASLCGSRQCPKCGKANNMQHGSDIIYSDGVIKHVMIIPADCGCSNRSCKNFRDMDEYWEVMQVDSP